MLQLSTTARCVPWFHCQVKREVVNASGTGNTEEILGDIDVVVDGCLR